VCAGSLTDHSDHDRSNGDQKQLHDSNRVQPPNQAGSRKRLHRSSGVSM
jgi:hypothetical protein